MFILGSAATVTATTGDSLREGVRNGTATEETRIISRVTGEQYGTRQSNISEGSNAGGSAIYGCRRPAKECTRHVNLANGPAAAFATKGSVPFTLSDEAVGIVPRLNADRVDNLHASEIIAAARAGKASSAAAADNATLAARALSADAVTGRVPLGKMTFVDASVANADEATARAAASEVKLREVGPFEIYGKCYVDSDAGPGATPSLIAELFIRTSQDGSVIDGGGIGVLVGDPFLNTTTPEITRDIERVITLDQPVVADLDEDPGVAMAPDGTAYEFRHAVIAKEATPPGGDGPYGPGTRCGFAVSLDN